MSTDRINRGIFTSGTDEWATPDSFMNVVREMWPEFDLDPCALPSSAKATTYYTPEDDGLVQPWNGDLIWMNPPYGREIPRWVKRAAQAVKGGATVVALLPARTDTAWWHDHVLPFADEIHFVRGRLHFGGDHERSAHNAPFPSVLVVMRSRRRRNGPSVKAMRRAG